MAQIEVRLDEGEIVLTMRGYLREDDCKSPIKEFHELIPDGNFVVTVRLPEMTGYEPEVRRLWTEALRPYRSRISFLRLVGVESSIVRMAGAAVGMVLGVKVEFTDE